MKSRSSVTKLARSDFMAHRSRVVVLTPKTLVLAWLCLTCGCGSDNAGTATTASGGTSSGGTATGGTATGGTATGGAATGGTATGGAATGGAATGGAATGGTADNGGTSTAGGAGGTTSASGCRVWVATDGDDANPGTEALPVLTLVKGYDLLCPAPPTGTANGAECLGEAPRTLCIKPGTYAMNLRLELRKTRMGTETSPVTIQGDSSSTTRPVLDFTTQPRVLSCGAPVDSSGGELTGITMNADYTVLKHVEIMNANDNCIKVQGAHNLVEDVVVHGCADAGIQISSGSGYTASGTNNTVLNCDSYQNNDTQCYGNGGDGFAVKTGTGAGNVFRGCRAWDNADDGFDLFAWTSPIVLDNCWAMNQATTTAGTNSDGDGFKLGGNSISTEHVLSNLVAVGNTNGSSGYGFNENTNPASMTCTGTCAAWDNRTNVGTIGGVSTTAIGSATAAAMVSAARNADGSLPAVSSL
jgi:hypothetical protein